MSQDVSTLVRGTKIRDLLFSGAVDACKQMQDVWPVLGEEERDRMTGLIDAWAIKTETELARRLGNLFDAFVASGQPSVAATENGINAKGDVVTLTLAAVRSQVPRDFFTHKGSFLIVMTAGNVASLEELNRQGDFFADDDAGPSPAAELAEQLRGESPIVAQFKASQEAAAEPDGVELEGIDPDAISVDGPAEDPLELFRDEFLIALGQITSPEFAAQYDKGGEFEGIAGIYVLVPGWTPTAAALNESLAPEERRPISDGPASTDGPVGDEGSEAA